MLTQGNGGGIPPTFFKGHGAPMGRSMDSSSVLCRTHTTEGLLQATFQLRSQAKIQCTVTDRGVLSNVL